MSKLTDLRHPCAGTCSGYQQGFEDGQRSVQVQDYSPSTVPARVAGLMVWLRSEVNREGAFYSATQAGLEAHFEDLFRAVRNEALAEAKAKVLAATDHADCNTCEVLRAVADSLEAS